MASSAQSIGRPERLGPILFGMISRWLIGTLLLLVAQPAFAQSLVSGTVTDPQSAVVPDARAALLVGQTEVRSTRTDALGRHRFDAVPPGAYVVSVSAPGFQPATSAGMVLPNGQGVTRDMSLAIATATDFVSVEGRANAAGYRVESVSSLGSLGRPLMPLH